MDIRLETGTDNPSLGFLNVKVLGGDFQAELHVKAGPFIAKSTFYCDKSALNQFVIGLREMETTLKGSATLKPILEPGIITMELDNLGHLDVRGEIEEFGNGKNLQPQKLIFGFRTDQTCLGDFERSLSQLLTNYKE
jgi:hypothetical protein